MGAWCSRRSCIRPTFSERNEVPLLNYRQAKFLEVSCIFKIPETFELLNIVVDVGTPMQIVLASDIFLQILNEVKTLYLRHIYLRNRPALNAPIRTRLWLVSALFIQNRTLKWCRQRDTKIRFGRWSRHRAICFIRQANPRACRKSTKPLTIHELGHSDAVTSVNSSPENFQN